MSISKQELYRWCETHSEEQICLLKELAAIPAPSHQEEKRAEYIKNWLIHCGADTVIMDNAKNVILPLGWNDSMGLAVMAHTDVVFPDTNPLPVRQENHRLYAPGVGDDTANVVALMLCAKYFLEFPQHLPEPLLIVFNSCEEGLGNLKGVRQIMADYGDSIRAFVSFDCQSDSVISKAVGSERWKVTISTRGGHSFSDFGTPNAIACLSELITLLYRQKVPEKECALTTYNVGLISGGTSVNTIAQNAEMTYEYRSNDHQCLAIMAEQFQNILRQMQHPDVQISVQSLGIRPCGEKIPVEEHNKLLERCKTAIESIYKMDIPCCAASTDANIPLSLGIPSATFGLYHGGGAHTREEYVDLDSLLPGLKIALTFFLLKQLDK